MIENERRPIREQNLDHVLHGLLKNAKVSKRPHTCEYLFLLSLAAPQKSSKSRWEAVQKIEDSDFSEIENMSKSMILLRKNERLPTATPAVPRFTEGI